MSAAKRLDRAAGVGIECSLLFIGPGLIGRGLQRTVIAREVGAREHAVQRGTRARNAQFPVVVETMFKFAEHGVDLDFLVFPVRAGVGRAGQVQVVAIGAKRQAAPEKVGLILLTRQAKGRRGRIRQVGFDYAIEHAVIAFFLVTEAVCILVGADYPATHRAAVVQWAGGVEHATVIVPTADSSGEGNLRIGGRALAHHIDSCRWIARACRQAGGASDHFNMVEHGQIGLHACRIARVGGGQAVVHDVVDVETAGRVGLTAGPAGLIEEQTGRIPDHVVDAGHGLIVHALPGNDGHRLRRFTHGQRQLGSRLHGTRGVGTTALGGGAELITADFGSTQFHSRRGRCFGALRIGSISRLSGCDPDAHCQQGRSETNTVLRLLPRHEPDTPSSRPWLDDNDVDNCSHYCGRLFLPEKDASAK
ncbi:hypothetical protein ALP99_102128 [Pseudomonas syringae pv. tomato]|nr:hypothetical protein ALQ00_102021 [Pseudomonas syringae pv. tomato]RMQ81036.1 hypothetical protein ALP99_102128 [Pseudomonas syringae pv. tomato]